MSMLYILMLAGFVGYVVISRVPAILHTPLMSGSNFIHGIVVIGAMIAFGQAQTYTEHFVGFIAIAFGAGNAVGGYIVTERMLEMFKTTKKADSTEGKADGRNMLNKLLELVKLKKADSAATEPASTEGK